MSETPFVRILGSAHWEPLPDNECAHYSLCDRILIDTGWGTVMNLMRIGIDPLQFDTICLTHTHADHYMGLAQLLMYRRIKKSTLGDLTILGPKETLRAGIDRTINFILHDSLRLNEEIREMPNIVEMGEGTSYEAAGFTIETINSEHTVPGVCYRITHKDTGRAVGFTGDTMYRPEFGKFFSSCELLIHEANFGAHVGNKRTWHNRHSDACEAAQGAKEAGVRRLLLTHCPAAKQQGAVEAAQALLDIPVGYAQPYKVYEF